jgi:hypothetical protein
MRELDTSGPTSLATVKLESGGTKYVRLYVREGHFCNDCGVWVPGGDEHDCTPADKDVGINNLRGISDYIAEKISDGIGHDRLIPLDKVGEYAFVDIEDCAIYLITIQNARLVVADSQPEASGEAGTVTRSAGSEEPT